MSKALMNFPISFDSWFATREQVGVIDLDGACLVILEQLHIGGCVNLKDNTFYNFKSHECHVFMQRLFPIVLRGMLPKQIWESILELCTFFRVICSRVLHLEDLRKLKSSIVITICKLEKIFPPGFFDSMEHLVIHLVNEAILGGLVQFRWMYPYER
ncbi:hypothetical protein HanHA300_Chr06g0217821 [Helianthus annuus]|nr:hypothetical protein HanHA300_Chr06g0217821 [Helianthus annuus]